MTQISAARYDIITAMPADALRSRTVANRRRALVLVTVASVPLGLAIGLLCWWGFGWPVGVVGFVVGTVAVGLTMWWAAEPLARRSLGGAVADDVSHARLLNLVDGLCATIGTTPPEVRIRNEAGLNAAVCGRRRRTATMVVTQGLLAELTRVELEGVVAQQLTRDPLLRYASCDGHGCHPWHRDNAALAAGTRHCDGPCRRELHPLPARADRRPRENGGEGHAGPGCVPRHSPLVVR